MSVHHFLRILPIDRLSVIGARDQEPVKVTLSVNGSGAQFWRRRRRWRKIERGAHHNKSSTSRQDNSWMIVSKWTSLSLFFGGWIGFQATIAILIIILVTITVIALDSNWSKSQPRLPSAHRLRSGFVVW